MRSAPFDSIYAHGFIRVAVGIPAVRVADPQFNVERTIDLAARASDDHAAVVLFPELGLSAYSNEEHVGKGDPNRKSFCGAFS